MSELRHIAGRLVAEGKGILAADESNGTMDKRLKAAGAQPGEEMRRALRELLFTTEGAAEHISGVILYDETFRQSTADGVPFPRLLDEQGIIPGIKVDSGAKRLAGSEDETVTEGLDGLRERLAEYYEGGARFAKWRAVLATDERRPSATCVHVNAHALARYAALCQEARIVPIVEPEVLMDGEHTIDRSEEVTGDVLAAVFAELRAQRVMLEGMLLKPNMVLAGYECADQPGDEEVAERTLRCLRRHVPAAVPGIVFLSGGQGDEDATNRLNVMNRMGAQPWEISFSYGRGLQAAALTTWRGEQENVADAQRQYAHRARCTGAARRGEYSAEMERELAAAS
ncbi:MAG: fructose-bisphosphate aldolase, class [Gaiellales bacterium]|jgi:fructose-bisphosphate aldolase class I|nr:fructose-bisphosphate aldolase, class [Gaiellales bacterium]MEA2221203.1 fructose-bisphosphate aldolase, class [Solirubrobacteraceae bacterium]